ncbi:response regulator [Larkinella rosea]|uniref:DNA-binding response regulator n=1 Tax=Larkinella rosea TaxID=2025312 RepID=A0A3P1C2U9_9BACT|nr:response regulator [Larkinella rosea]RRB07602.1 DNA-binding response regulator [Larkinella rosea]
MESLQILIIEDDLLTATDLKDALESAGHRVPTIARNYQEAMAAVRRQKPDMALIDINLERSTADGITTARDMLAIHRMPIIYLTANSEVPTFQRARETNPAAYLIKPFHQNEIVFQIELAYCNRAMGGRQTNHQEYAESLFLPINKGYEQVAKKDVLYLLAEGAYVKVFMLDAEKPHLLSMNLGYLAQYFPLSHFYRLSRSLLVNLNHIERMEQNQLFMRHHPTPISVPNNSRADLLKKLGVIRTR